MVIVFWPFLPVCFSLPRSPGHTSTVHYTSDAFDQPLVNKGTMDTLDLNHMLTSSSPYALTPVKSPIEPFGQREKHHLLSQQQQQQKTQQQQHQTSTSRTVANKNHPGHVGELSLKEQLTMEDNIHNDFDDYYPEISGRDETSESKWIFDPDKGWVPNPNVSPVPCINHHTLYSSSATTTTSGHKKKKYDQSKATSSSTRDAADEFSLLADAPGKGLGAKITAVLGGDVVTVIGSQTGNEPIDTGKEVPPPPAPDFPDVKRPGSGLKRSSPVSPTKKPVIKERKSNEHSSDHRSALGLSKKDMWKNSTKTESMIWSTVDEELVDANNQFNINCIDDPSHSNNFYAHNLSENNLHSSLKHQQPSTSSSSSLSKVHPSPSTLTGSGIPGKPSAHVHHKLPQVPLGPKPKRNSLERQNEISFDDRPGPRPIVDSTSGYIGHGTTNEMSSIASFTSQIQSSQSSAIYTGHHQQPFDKQSFNSQFSTDPRSNHGLITSSSTTGLPIVTASTNEQQFHLHDSRLDQSTKLPFTSASDHLTQSPYNLQSQLQQQQQQQQSQQQFAPSSLLPSSMLPPSTYSSSSSSIQQFVTSSIATTAPSTTLPTSQFQQQQQQHQPQPPSALRHESKAPGESQKTVTFSEQLHQEVTFNPSNASSPFPINESIHPSFDTLSPSVSIKDVTGQLDKSSSLYYTNSAGDISLTSSTSMTSESIIHPPSTVTATTSTSMAPATAPTSSSIQQSSSTLLLEPPPGALRRSSITSISGQQQQQLTLGQQGQGQLGQLSQQGTLLDGGQVAVPTSDIKPGDESIITTGGLRDYEPDNVEGLSKARIRWLAAFNKVVAQMNEVSAFILLFL